MAISFIKASATGLPRPIALATCRGRRTASGISYLCRVLKLLIFIIILYFGYRLAFGPPLLKGRDNTRIKKEKDDDGYTDYEEIS